MAEYQLDQKPGEDLMHYYRRLAKTADQRLVRLEEYSDQSGYKTATQWAYSKAVKDIAKWNKGVKGLRQLRFNTAPPESKEDLIAKINDIKSFIASPTSTKQGITAVYKKRAQTVNSRYGTSFTWQQLAKYYESGQATVWDEKFGSKTALKTIGQIQKNKKKLIKGIEDADKKDIRADSAVLQKTVEMALADDDLKIDQLIK